MRKPRFNERLVLAWLAFGTALAEFGTAIVNAFFRYLVSYAGKVD